MKITHVSVNFGRTFPMPNFAAARIDAGFGADLEEGEDPKAAHAELHRMAMTQVRAWAEERGYIRPAG